MAEQEHPWLFTAEVQTFLCSNEDKAPESFLLSKALANKGWDTKVLVRQLKGLKIAKSKIPTWYRTQGIVYPVSVSLEQASSELTARYKASLLQGDRGVDLSGGMGVDAYFLGRYCTHFVYVEPLQTLHDRTVQNFKALGVSHIQTVCAGAAEFLNDQQETYDWVYVDPSRRKEGQRMAAFAAWEPDVVGLKSKIWRITNRLLIKLSPMIDIAEVCKEVGEVKEVHVLSDRNECKEVLLLVEKGWTAPYRILAVLLKQDQQEVYGFTVAEEQATVAEFSVVKQYVYEPDVALLKAGAFKKIAVDQQVYKIHPHTHLYTSDTFNDHFLGRCFQVEQVVECTKKNIKDLIGTQRDFHVLTRNALLTADQVKSQWKLIERGDLYLMLFKGLNGLQYIAKAKRIF